MNGQPPEGQLRLRASLIQGRTVVTDQFRTAPFHPSPVRYRANQAVVVLQEVGPGILPGDRLRAAVTVGDGAALVVAGQGAARIYPSPHGETAWSRTELVVAAGGSLRWLPGDLIPYRDACYESVVHVRLEPGARLALLDIITPGRLAMGERDAYTRLDLRTRIDVAGKPVLIDRALLDSATPAPHLAPGRDSYHCSGTLTLVGHDLPADADHGPDDVWLGADGGPQLALVRGASRSAASLRAALLALLDRLEENQSASDRKAASVGG